MSTFEDPDADAEQAPHALRARAHATRRIDDPTQIHPVLGSLSGAAASFEESLPKLASFHDADAWPSVDGDHRAGRTATHQVSGEAHRAAEIFRQVASAVDHRHQIEATLTYSRPDHPLPPIPHRAGPARRPSQ